MALNIKTFLFGPKTIEGKPIINLVSPISAGAVKGAQIGGNILKMGFTGVKNLIQRSTTNPLAGATTLKAGVQTFGKKVLGASIGGLSAGTAFQTSRNVLSGKPFDAKDILKSGLVGASFGLNPLGAMSGIAAGTTEAIIGKGKHIDLGGYTLPNIDAPKTPTIDIQAPDLSGFNIPQMQPINISMQTPQTPSVSSGGFSPSFSVGSGGSDILPLLLLAGGLGLGGLALAKRKKKKKKKKYKKRKRV